MSQELITPHSSGNAGQDDASWKSLYKLAGVAALIATVLFLSDVIVLIALGNTPATASDWFALLQDDPLVGILQLFFSDLIGLTLLIPVFLALYILLRETNRAYTTLATVLAFIGIAIVIATNLGYSMIYLSEQYAAATAESYRSQLLAAGETLLATGASGTGPLAASLLLETALLILSVIMLRGNIFSKWIAYLGIVAHGLDVAHAIIFIIFIPLFGSALAVTVGVPLLWIGGTLQLVWYPLVGWRLLRIGQSRPVNP